MAKRVEPAQRKYAKYDSTILSLHSQGLTNRAIASKLGIPHWHPGRVIKENGLQSNGRRRGVRLVDGDLSLCSVCDEWKPTITNFQRIRGTSYLLTYCNACRKEEQDRNINSDFRKYLSSRYQRIKDRAARNGLEFDLTKEFLVGLYEEQNGLCFYTDTEMVLKAGEGRSRHGLSLDRIDPSRGYTTDNVVFCTVRVNSAKSDFSLEELQKWMPEWYGRIVKKMLLFHQ